MTAPLAARVFVVVRSEDGQEWIDLQSIAYTREAADEDRKRHDRRTSHAYKSRNKFIRIGRFILKEER